MPILQVYYPEGALQGERKSSLAKALTEVLLTMEGGAQTQGGRAFATVLFTEVSHSDWWVGGHTDTTYVQAPGKFLVRVSVPEGYMNQAHKTEVHSAVSRAIVDIESPGAPGDGTNVLVIIEEVLEGNWGAAGKTLTLTKIADAVGLSRTGERFKWVRAYFDAKARSYAAAKYPADAGGLLAP